MNKTRTIIDGIEIQTSLSAVEIAELEKQVKKQKEVIDELKNYLNERIEVWDNILSSPFCNFKQATKERLIYSQCLGKLEDLEKRNNRE